MIVVIEAWVHCEIDLTYFFLQIIFLVFSLTKVGFRVKVRPKKINCLFPVTPQEKLG